MIDPQKKPAINRAELAREVFGVPPRVVARWEREGKPLPPAVVKGERTRVYRTQTVLDWLKQREARQ